MAANAASVLAVGLMVAVGRAHPFVQGNKRTAFAAAQLLLYANDFFLDVPDIELIADELRRAMTGETPEYILVVLFEEFLRTLDDVALITVTVQTIEPAPQPPRAQYPSVAYGRPMSCNVSTPGLAATIWGMALMVA